MAITKKIDLDDQLHEEITQFYADPLGYVMYVFPWGVPGTPLAKEEGPDQWQKDLLTRLGEKVKAAEIALDKGAMLASIREAVSSGHGVGKTAFVSWVIKWFMSTREDPQVIVTANTEAQLTKKTWRELFKWNNMALDGHWFEWKAQSFKYRARPATWFAIAQTWSEANPDAFQGTHEENVLLIFDEASGIPNVIWDSAEGAMTTPRCIWLAFGNMTRASGRFVDCFGKFRHRWGNTRVDSRKAKKTNKAQIREWIEDYGEDSDFVRVRVKGEKPRAGTIQFISSDIYEAAVNREVDEKAIMYAPRLLGVDVARHGDDQSVATERRGLKVFKSKKWRNIDTMQLASEISLMIVKARDEGDPYRAVFIDATGIGWGVYDRLCKLGHESVCFAVQVGERAREPEKYFNKRAEIWDHYKEWLKGGGSVPEDDQLKDDTLGPEYGFDAKERIQIERKKDMKKRGLPSPDVAESVILTFAESIGSSFLDYPSMQSSTDGTWMSR